VSTAVSERGDRTVEIYLCTYPFAIWL